MAEPSGTAAPKPRVFGASAEAVRQASLRKDTKVWNEELVSALRAREDLAKRQGKQSQITWRQGAALVESVRKDIYMVRA